MRVEKDFEEFIRLLNFQKVEYLIVGAYALIYYTYPRNTGDIDIFINSTHENAEKMLNVTKKESSLTEIKVSRGYRTSFNIFRLALQGNRLFLLPNPSGYFYTSFEASAHLFDFLSHLNQ